MPEKKTREVKTPSQRLADINSALADLDLRAEELAAKRSQLEVQRKRILHSNPELSGVGEASAEG